MWTSPVDAVRTTPQESCPAGSPSVPWLQQLLCSSTADHTDYPPHQNTSWTLLNSTSLTLLPSLETYYHQVPLPTWLSLKIFKSTSPRDWAPSREKWMNSWSELGLLVRRRCDWSLTRTRPRTDSEPAVSQFHLKFKRRRNSKHWLPFCILWAEAMQSRAVVLAVHSD